MGRKVVDGGGEPDVLLAALPLGKAVDGELQVRVVDVHLALDAVRRVAAVDVDVLVVVAVVVEGAHQSVGLDGQRLALARQQAAEHDLGADVPEVVVVQEVAQVDVLGVHLAVELVLPADDQVAADVAGIGVQLAVGDDVLHARTLGEARQVDVA